MYMQACGFFSPAKSVAGRLSLLFLVRCAWALLFPSDTSELWGGASDAWFEAYCLGGLP